MYFPALAVLTLSAVQAIPFSHAIPLNSGAADYPDDPTVQTGGFATLYDQHNTAGACGAVHKDTDFVAAIDVERYGNLGEVSPLCGKEVKITNTKNGQSVKVTITDACCVNGNSIDLSITAFETIATYDEGMVPIEWFFL